MKNLVFFFLLALPFFQGCTHDHRHGGKAETVQLDNGKRWQANPETTLGIAKMQEILKKYEGQTADNASRKALQKELKTTFQEILKNCTMTGEAHNQLHRYLMPMQEIFGEIGRGTASESEQAVSRLRQHLIEYETFFQ